MRHDILELDEATHQRLVDLELNLEDAEAIRLLLAGGSVIDWNKAAFEDIHSVDRLLSRHLLDYTDPMDRQRLQYVFREAVAYVEDFRGIRLEEAMRNPDDVREVFLWASDARGFRRRQVLSCMILKIMHVLNHLEAADLKTRIRASEQELLAMAHDEVLHIGDRMRRAGIPLHAFYGSRKTRTSIITKLLAKRDNVATPIFDKLRFRIVVEQEADVIPALTWLTRYGFPYNRVIPGQCHNNLIDPATLDHVLAPEARTDLQPLVDDPVRASTTKNEFSGNSYRIINFIVDLPIRIPDELLPTGRTHGLGRVVYMMAEFQVVDAMTAKTNEEGENAHALYKARQHERVLRRLVRGEYT